MPNQIDGNGIQTKTYSEILASLTTAFQTIYGADVNLAQNSPDGQLINLLALMIMDQGDFIVQDYDAKDPDQAIGLALDGVSQLCGITRKGGSYTTVSVTVTTDRGLNLTGLDTSDPFTISDSSGNQFQLITSATLTTGANTLTFQAANVGNVQVAANTLTIATTVVLGVLSVNNPAGALVQGVDQETDANFRIRRQSSIALPSQGNLSGLVGGLYTVLNLVQAIVYENTTNSVDSNGVPAQGIWVIVNGGASADIAEIIYKYRPLGCPMKGSVSVNVTQVDSSTFAILFDRAVAQDLYVNMTVASKSGGAIDTAALKTALVAAWTFSIYQTADITTLNSLVHVINPDLIVSSEGVSRTAGSYTSSIAPTNKYNYFTLTTAHITVTT